MERRNQERELATKKRGSSFKLFSRSSKNMEEEIKKEFEAKSKPRKIDIKALEESRKEKVKQSSENQQKDFRHLLKRADQPRSKKGAGTKSGEKRQNKGDSDEHPHRSKHLPRNLVRGQLAPTQAAAAELTGSWDYIPSPPSSTVDLLAHQQEERRGGGQERRRVKADYHQDDETTGEEHDDMMASAPMLDLQGMANINTEMDWDENIRTGGRHKINQDFDFETQF